MRTLETKRARQLFERYHGAVSPATWYRILKVFDADLPLTVDNVKMVAEVRKLLPKSDLRSIKAIADVKATRKWLAHQNYQTTGEYLLRQFKSYGIVIHPNTLTRWFKPVGGFSRSRYYSLSELMPVVIYAHSYALKKQLKEVACNGLGLKVG